MKSHWIKRIVRLLVLLFGVSILCFILTALSTVQTQPLILCAVEISLLHRK